MSKTKKILMSIFGVGAAITTAVATSCGPTGGGSEDGKLVAVVMTDPENPIWVKAKSAAEAALEKQGLPTVANIIKSQSDQNSWIQTQLDAHSTIKYLLLAPTDTGAATAVQNAKERNVTVIAYDKLIPAISDNYNWYVSFDNERVGELQGLAFLSGIYKYQEPGEGKDNIFDDETTMLEWVKAHKLAEKGIFYTVGGDPADNNARLFYDPAVALIKKAQEIDPNLVNGILNDSFSIAGTPDWNYALAKNRIATELEKLKVEDKDNVVGILVPNDGMANVMVEALADAEINNVILTGLDANETAYNHIKNGKQMITIDKPDSRTTEIASLMIKALYEKSKEAGKDVDLTPEEMEAAIKKYAPDLKYKFRIVSTDPAYQVTSADGKSKKFIKSVIIEPVIITKDNVEQIKPGV
ncbi:46 kDa surface antigen [Mycoplasmopsis californica]|uniref:Substrate-binding domain-containing protein n=1 Tax=Mycoplasmopsis equigenitalium TaxID=114883 RepID=A0ABY5J5W4_9BACT|nr:substrate-binding domain-containing protein [Mycoplasmopsis equigenitalium]UUD37266.1 substrate-binding domain-containing protein [Mycoplasmopsis equigenitalium]VEU69425.1 46 kDa surface antigen [Mycoplasmopsis californica]